jgi:hypothetical protein
LDRLGNGLFAKMGVTPYFFIPFETTAYGAVRDFSGSNFGPNTQHGPFMGEGGIDEG